MWNLMFMSQKVKEYFFPQPCKQGIGTITQCSMSPHGQNTNVA